MVNFDLLLKNRLLIKELTGENAHIFFKQMEQYKKRAKKRSFKIINTIEKQYLFLRIVENNNITNGVYAQLLGVKHSRQIFDWKKALRAKNDITKPKIKKLGDFFYAFPNIQDVITTTELPLQYQLTTSSTKEEIDRLFKLVITESERLATLMKFREEIVHRNQNISIDTFILDGYNKKYGIKLQGCSLKELAYLWGVSIEYMTRVLNVALSKLQSEKKELWERLIVGYE